MEEVVKIPMFPLAIFPLPGELVPLHIFEPRYKQLLAEAEARDFSFGILFNHVSNPDKFGSLVKLESVIKRYPGGESDIIVKCVDLITLHKLYRTFRDKLYPGGDVTLWNVLPAAPAQDPLKEAFVDFLRLQKIQRQDADVTLFDVANEVNLDFEERLRFVKLDDQHREKFLFTRIRYQLQLFDKAEKAKDVFHLN